MIWEMLFVISFWLFVLATVIYMLYAARLIREKVLAGFIAAALGCLLELVGVLIRWHQGGYVPLSNTYEALVFFSWCIVVIYLVVERIYKVRTVGAYVMPLAVLSLGVSSLFPVHSKSTMPLVPALQSFWLPFHVVTCFIGYGAFAVSFGVSVMYLLKLRGLKEKEEEKLATLGEINYRMITFGVLLLALGIMSGAVWANVAWGRYWGWDPKETWSLISWLYYLLVLHLRFAYGVSGRRFALLSLLGLVLVVFTFFGVNYLLSGLHAYT